MEIISSFQCKNVLNPCIVFFVMFIFYEFFWGPLTISCICYHFLCSLGANASCMGGSLPYWSSCFALTTVCFHCIDHSGLSERSQPWSFPCSTPLVASPLTQSPPKVVLITCHGVSVLASDATASTSLSQLRALETHAALFRFMTLAPVLLTLLEYSFTDLLSHPAFTLASFPFNPHLFLW